jgi:hypothetical protein
MHIALGLLEPSLQLAHHLHDEVDVVVLVLLCFGDEGDLTNLRISDAPFPIEI